MKARHERASRLFRLAAQEFGFLSAFRQALRAGPHPEPERVDAEITAILRAQAQEAAEDPWLDALYERARYVLVVLADEVLLHSGWNGAPRWQERLLEARHFGTNIGGERFFTLAAALGPDEVELAALMLAALALGFRGRHRDDPARLLDARRQVQRLLVHYLARTSDKVTPAAYHVLQPPPRPLVPLLTAWRVALVALGGLVAYVALATLAWRALAADVVRAARALAGP